MDDQGDEDGPETSVEPSSGTVDKLFVQATQYLPYLTDQLSTDVLLYFYAHYKQATVGRCTTPKPGFFDLTGRKKWQSWVDLGDMSTETARMNYVTKLKEIDPTWNPQDVPVQPSVYVSRMPHLGVSDAAANKLSADGVAALVDETPIFSAVKDGRLDLVRSILQSSPDQVHSTDTEGMTPLHWAADRGYQELCTFLIDHAADVHTTDAEGQTPLHYACSCSQVGVAKLLLSAGASPDVQDKDGQSPVDLLEAQYRAELSI